MDRQSRKIGYMRVSTDEQDMALQKRALLADGVHPDDIFHDKKSGKTMQRAGLRKAIRQAWPGDVLVVWKLDRLGRSLSGLLQTVEELEASGIQFRSLTEQIDTSSPGGRMVMHMMMAMAEFERNIIAERTKAGMAAKRAANPTWKPGQKHRVMDYPDRLERFRELFRSGELKYMTGRKICDELNKYGPKDKPISVQSYGNWKRDNFKGAVDDIAREIAREEDKS